MTQEEKEKILGKIEKLQYYWCDEEITQCALNEIKKFIDSMPVNQQETKITEELIPLNEIL